MLRNACWNFPVTTCKKFAKHLQIDLGTATTLFNVLFVMTKEGLKTEAAVALRILAKRFQHCGVDDWDEPLEESMGRSNKGFSGIGEEGHQASFKYFIRCKSERGRKTLLSK